MPVQPQYFGLQGFAFPTVPATTCDYPDEDDVREGVVYADGDLVGTLRGYVGDLLLPDSFDHSPADIVRALLILKGLGSTPPDRAAWPVYSSREPHRPDDAITTYNTTGVDDGSDMWDGKNNTHFGILIRVRSTLEPVGWAKAGQIREAILSNEVVYDEVVTIGDNTYLVHCFSRVGEVFALGTETPTSKRRIYTVNATVDIVAVEP